MGIFGVDFDLGRVLDDVVHLKTGEFADPDAGLQENFDDGIEALVQAASIPQGSVLHFGEDTGWGDFNFGVGDVGGGVVGDETL